MGILKDYDLRRASAGLLLLTIGLFCMAFVAVNLARDVSLWVFGRRARAVVVESWAEPTGGESGFQYFVRYQFLTADGQVISRTTSVAAQEWAGLGMGGPVGAVYQEQALVPPDTAGGLERGGSVEVVYFPPYPAHNRLDESRFVPVLACAYLPLVSLSWVGLALGWRLSTPIRARVLQPSGVQGRARDGLRQGASRERRRRSDPVRAASKHGGG